MIFQRAEPTSGYRILRLVSEEARWELGLSEYAHGIRIRMGRCGRPPSVIDFCLGHDRTLYAPVLLAVLERLGPLPESAGASEIDAVFPWAGTRPETAVHVPILLARIGVPVGERGIFDRLQNVQTVGVIVH